MISRHDFEVFLLVIRIDSSIAPRPAFREFYQSTENQDLYQTAKLQGLYLFKVINPYLSSRLCRFNVYQIYEPRAGVNL